MVAGDSLVLCFGVVSGANGVNKKDADGGRGLASFLR